jgi:hypothetical protein
MVVSCQGDDEDAFTVDSETSRRSEAIASIVREDQDRAADAGFLTKLHEAGLVDGAGGGALSTLGHRICDYLDAGHDPVEAGVIAIQSGYTPAEAGTLVGITVTSYCPEYA